MYKWCNLETACWGLRPTTGLNGCQMMMITVTDGWYFANFIGVNSPAFGGTVPHFHLCPAKSADVPHFSKMVLLLLFSLPIILHVCLATQQSDELRIKIGKDRFKIRTPTGHWNLINVHCITIIVQCDRCHLSYTRGSRRQRLFIFSTLPRPPAASTLLP